MNAFARKLKKLRTEAGLSQVELGRKARINCVQIAQYELGIHVPRPDKQAALLKALGEGEEERPSPPPRRETDQSRPSPVRLGAVSKAWVEQMADAHVHSRGMVLVDGPVRVVTIRREDLIDLCATILRSCGTNVEV